MYLKIGDFSRLARVSLKTLHHYDEIHLFKPAYVDRFTGYRYYALDQLPRLNRILALRDLGFALEQIRQMLGEELLVSELRDILQQRQSELEREMIQAREKLARVEIRLRWIEQEGKMPEIEVLLKQVPSLVVAGDREVVPAPSLMRERCLALNEEVCAFLRQEGLRSDGISLAIYYDSSESGIDVEMAYRLEEPAEPVSNSELVVVHELSAAEVAYAVYHGSYDDFAAVGQVHASICEWAAESGYRLAGASREYYLRPPQQAGDPVGVMEIQYPVERG